MTDHNSSDDPLDDDDELELEPLDPEILEHQRARAQRQTRAAEDSVDVNQVFDDAVVGDPVDLEQLKQFRFTTRHLLIVTAVAAMAMTVFVNLGGCMGLFVSGCVALGAGWWFVLREEKQRLVEVEERREKLAQWMAAKRAKEDGQPLPTVEQAEIKQFNADLEAEEDARPSFKFAFSMKEILGAFAIAAVMLTLVRWIGGPQNAALLLGFVALAGLLVQAFEVELPPLVILGWWLLLVLYILVNLWAAFGSGDEVAWIGEQILLRDMLV